MSVNEEELQRKTANGELPAPGEELDLQAYKVVFEALGKSEPVTLRSGFADRLVAKAVARQKKASSMDFVWFVVGIVSLIVGCIVAIVKTEFKLNLGFLAGMSAYGGVFVFGIAFVILLNVIDKRLKRSFQEFDSMGSNQ